MNWTFTLIILTAAAVSAKYTPMVSTSVKNLSASEPSIVSSAPSKINDEPQSGNEAEVGSLHEPKNQDPYVNAAPLSVAAVCSDGIALIALHYGVGDEYDEAAEDQDKLKITSPMLENDGKKDQLASSPDKHVNEQTSQIEESKKHLGLVFRDLPVSTRGPLRIEQVYNCGANTSSQQINSIPRSLPPPMSILTAGWRTDGMTLASAARDLISEERMLYCMPHLAVSGEICNGVSITSGSQSKLITESMTGKVNNLPERCVTAQPYFGRRIAEGLSYYLAKCDFSESARSLSTVGLLAVGSNDASQEGSIFLIDATGSYRVRAHAIGAGASLINKRMGYVDFSKMNCREGLRVLLRLIAEEGGLNGKQSLTEDRTSRPLIKGIVQENISQLRSWSLPRHIALELAMLNSGDRFMKRVKLLAI
jgi:hypothetical protein